MRGRSLELTPQALTLALTVIVTHSVWKQSGAPIAIVIEVAIAAALILNGVWAAWSVGRVDIRFIDCPTDAIAGTDVPGEVEVSGPTSPVDVRLVSSPDVRLYRIVPPERGRLSAVAGSRGVATAAVFDVRSTAPIGLIGVRRRFVVPLPHPLYVAPQREPMTSVQLGDRGDEDVGGEIVRGARPYVSGDPLRLVHWPSTARTGTLTVRELEPPKAPELAVIVHLTGARGTDERAARRAAWLADEGLRRGLTVVLATCERERPVTARVRSPLEVGRRLAAAVKGEPVCPPTDGPGPHSFAIQVTGTEP